MGSTPRLSSVTEQVVGGNPVTTAVTYDNAGNQTTDTWTRTYNPRNQQSRVTVGAGMNRVDYDYDYDGRSVRVRVVKTPRLGQQLGQLSFYTPELRLLSKSDWNRVNTTAPATFGTDIVWFNGEPIAQATTGQGMRYTFTDHLGTPLVQTDNSARVMWQAEYEPYGNAYYRNGTATDQILRLPGQEVAEYADGFNQDNYNIFRWYRSGWGRYTQADPLATREPRIFQKQTRAHEYAYVDQNPINASDPTGLCKNCDTCPSGRWTVDPFGFGASAAAVGGITYQQTVYTCQDNGYAVTIKTTCAVFGAIVGAGLGVTAPGKACGCNVSDLLNLGSASKGWTGWIGPVNIDINNCTDFDPIATSGGISKSWGAGFAKTWCWSEEKK